MEWLYHAVTLWSCIDYIIIIFKATLMHIFIFLLLFIKSSHKLHAFVHAAYYYKHI